MASRIVTTTYRYKRPLRKRKTVAIEAPAVVTARSRRHPPVEGIEEEAATEVVADHTLSGGSTAKHTARVSTTRHSTSVNDDPKPVTATKPAIVTTGSAQRGGPRRAADPPAIPMFQLRQRSNGLRGDGANPQPW
jgi:hypothetical protein